MFVFFTCTSSLLTYTKKNRSLSAVFVHTCTKFYLDLSNRFGDKTCGWEWLCRYAFILCMLCNSGIRVYTFSRGW